MDKRLYLTGLLIQQEVPRCFYILIRRRNPKCTVKMKKCRFFRVKFSQERIGARHNPP